MTSIDIKKDCFEYSIDKFIDWYKEINPEKPEGWKTDFTKLKLIKLNFFLSAVNAKEDSDGLLNIFDNYFAMPYGHVESDVYSSIADLTRYNIGNTGTDLKPGANVTFNTIEHQEEIDRAIESLKRENKDLINYGAFKLVELSHQWYSWINMFNLAKMRGDKSIAIPSSLIKNESKIFKLEYASF
ncbi:type II toxin-antitoxin system antitoxin SocA domain-containing protein [Alistipes sp. ZOR0009]|uniref:type II toxin-antitoxin system antitoxin SocA domain-containing protein n=1 Tax=Alistipes sp. ZOR0009 TaxID=1339253 RepID=UPI00068C884C|nr:type II toxin-antitoxin system antitoxin SocA domain-containing protein [Alistipes sp. ZOR0009]